MLMDGIWILMTELDYEIRNLLDYGHQILKQIDYLSGKIEVLVFQGYQRQPLWGDTYCINISPIDYKSKEVFIKEFYTTTGMCEDIPNALDIIFSEIKDIFNVLYGLPNNSIYSDEIKDNLYIIENFLPPEHQNADIQEG